MKQIRHASIFLFILIIGLFVIFGCSNTGISSDENIPIQPSGPEESRKETGNIITGNVSQTKALLEGSIRIAGIGEYTFNPLDIRSIRDDLFNEGYFSVFDILVHLDDVQCNDRYGLFF
jgi:hypothetical protein